MNISCTQKYLGQRNFSQLGVIWPVTWQSFDKRRWQKARLSVKRIVELHCIQQKLANCEYISNLIEETSSLKKQKQELCKKHREKQTSPGRLPGKNWKQKSAHSQQAVTIIESTHRVRNFLYSVYTNCWKLVIIKKLLFFYFPGIPKRNSDNEKLL